ILAEQLHGPDEADWVGTLDAEWPDVRTVVRRAFGTDDANTVITVVTHLCMEFFYRRPEAFAWVSEAEARYGDFASPYRHELLGAAAQVAFTVGDGQTA